MFEMLSMQINFTCLFAVFLLLRQITLSNLCHKLSKYIALSLLLGLFTSRWINKFLHIMLFIWINDFILGLDMWEWVKLRWSILKDILGLTLWLFIIAKSVLAVHLYTFFDRWRTFCSFFCYRILLV